MLYCAGGNDTLPRNPVSVIAGCWLLTSATLFQALQCTACKENAGEVIRSLAQGRSGLLGLLAQARQLPEAPGERLRMCSSTSRFNSGNTPGGLSVRNIHVMLSWAYHENVS